MSGQSSSPCWWVKDDSTSTFWHAAGVLNSMRYSHLLGSVTCTNSFVEPHRRFTYESHTKQRFNTVSGWQCNFSLDLCTLIRANEKQGDETRPWKLHWKAMEYTRVPFTLWALSIYEKNSEISVVAKVEFPIGKKLFHLVVSPGTWRGARPWTWNWYKPRET